MFRRDLTDSIGMCAASRGVQSTNPMRKIFRKIVIAADRSGAGKTTVSCGLLAVLKKRGVKVQSFKCGPDYIDPMFHRRVLGVPSGNLDSFFTDATTLRHIFRDRTTASDAQLALVEGVMGYYDGLGGVSSAASTSEIARILDAPTILVMDAKGASVTIAALVRGMLQFEEETDAPDDLPMQASSAASWSKVNSEEETSVRTEAAPAKKLCRRQGGIRGLLLNRVSPMFYPRLKNVIEEYCPGIEVLGYLPDLPELKIPSRHLGLVEPEELQDFRNWADRVAEELEKCVDVDRLLEIAAVEQGVALDDRTDRMSIRETKIARETIDREENRPSFDPAAEVDEKAGCTQNSKMDTGIQRSSAGEEKAAEPETAGSRMVRIAISEDEAFNFMYQENRAMLEQLGAELVPFSPLHDAALPVDVDGLILSGGYPELYKDALSANASMRASVADAIKRGIPTIAECGGYMYLLDAIEQVSMCGVLAGDARRKERLVRFGYIEAETQRDSVLGPAGTVLRGHEFHRYDCDFNGADCTLTKPAAGSGRAATTARSYEGIYLTDSLAAGFPHFYYWSHPEAIAHYIETCRRWKTRVTRENV